MKSLLQALSIQFVNLMIQSVKETSLAPYFFVKKLSIFDCFAPELVANACKAFSN